MGVFLVSTHPGVCHGVVIGRVPKHKSRFAFIRFDSGQPKDEIP